MRSIGAVYDDSHPGDYFYEREFPREFDLLMYVATTTPSTLLPFP